MLVLSSVWVESRFNNTKVVYGWIILSLGNGIFKGERCYGYALIFVSNSFYEILGLKLRNISKVKKTKFAIDVVSKK